MFRVVLENVINKYSTEDRTAYFRQAVSKVSTHETIAGLSI